MKEEEKKNSMFWSVFTVLYILACVVALATVGHCMHSVATENVGWCEVEKL